MSMIAKLMAECLCGSSGWLYIDPCTYMDEDGEIMEEPYFCECSGCGLRTKPFDGEMDAINAWNDREVYDDI